MSIRDSNPPMSTTRIHRTAGFTLIEILVVVAIIALLIAILLPSLLKAREQSTGAVCRSNMHQIMLGMQMYVASDKVLPGNFDVWANSWVRAGRPTGAPNWKPQDTWLGLPYPPKVFDHRTSSTDQQALWDFVKTHAPKLGSLYKYVRSEGPYLCPKDKPDFPDPEDVKGGGGNGRFSYTMTRSLGFKPPERATSFAYVARFEQKRASGYTTPVWIPAGTRIQWTASKMIALVEEHPWNNINHGVVSDSWTHDTYLAFRHHADNRGGMGMFAFLDGHVEGKRYPFFVHVPGTNPPVYEKLFGVDIMNEYKMPYAWNGNTGGPENDRAFIREFPYPYK